MMVSIKKRTPHLAACAMFGATLLGSAAMADPDGITYKVHVRTSFGTVFKDCFSFDSEHTLAVAGLGALTFNDNNGFGPGKHSFFEATTPASLVATVGDSISLTGYGFSFGKNGGTGYIKGIGMSGSNHRYVFNGQPDATCALSAKTIGTNPYMPAQ